MFRHLKRLHHVKTAGIINLLFWNLLLTLYLLADRYSGIPHRDLILVFIYLFIAATLLNALLFFTFKSILGMFRYGAVISYVAANLTVTITAAACNTASRELRDMPLREALVTAMHGWPGGESGEFIPGQLIILLTVIAWTALFSAAYALLDRLLESRRAHSGLFGASVFTFTLIMFLLHFRLIAAASTDWRMNLMMHDIPWKSMTGFPEDCILINEGAGSSGAFPGLFLDPLLLDERTELEQLKKLDAARERILTSFITVKRPMNILFINIESLRSDMLNPANMPFLYRFATERGFILKKHYSTGNNTPGSLFGMLTGLSPCYFEPLRRNRFHNIALEVLERAEYRQSVYYNSPRNYEWIYRDIIEPTNDTFVTIPGRVEDYGPREQRLIDRYIRDLKNDSDHLRFDYYLMNVSHFNYYYPDEFRKFTPDYRPDFRIISGPQQKFRKDRVELKNRYMNSVYYADSLLKQLITEMDIMGRLENTIIVIAGDHGEEFWEHGSFGHTWGLNNIQVQPAAMIYYPGIKGGDISYTYTSHQDFLPTVFDLIGISSDREFFTTGKSLLRYDPDLDYALTSLGILYFLERNGYSITGDGYKILFRNNMDLNRSPYAIYDDNDREVDEIDTYRAVDLLMKAACSKRLKQNP